MITRMIYLLHVYISGDKHVWKLAYIHVYMQLQHYIYLPLRRVTVPLPMFGVMQRVSTLPYESSNFQYTSKVSLCIIMCIMILLLPVRKHTFKSERNNNPLTHFHIQLPGLLFNSKHNILCTYNNYVAINEMQHHVLWLISMTHDVQLMVCAQLTLSSSLVSLIFLQVVLANGEQEIMSTMLLIYLYLLDLPWRL